MSLKVENISFGYTPEREILSNISFEVGLGKTLFLLGPNGTGKTTLLKCINHVLKPNSGRVLINEEDVAGFSPAVRAKKIGYVPQYNNNVFPMNVIDTVMLGRAAFVGYKMRSLDKDIVFDVIDRLELGSFAFKNINEMSGGERQRVFIARALAQEPELIILDEPTSSLDLKNQMFTLKLVTELAQSKNIGVVLSVHDMNLTSLFADKVIILKESRIYACGKPADTLTEKNIREVYGVDTSVTLEEGYTHVRLKKV
ncbi:ABC transporter ATP-binding protein [Lachnospiraceae bacterium NSJ-143]|nr:ABC transporter ATP-binding protein [Lachnospiraceae bacterium NSJ-143]